MLTLVKNDLHNIARRLRIINSSYCLFRNNREGRFEVHNAPIPNSRTLCFVSPFDELDERTLIHAWRTSIENYDDLSAEFDAHNRELTQSADRAVRQKQTLLADMMDFASRSEQEIVFEKGANWF